MKKRLPYSPIHESPKSLIVGGQPKTAAFLIVRGTVERTERAVRESDDSLNPPRLRAFADARQASLSDDDIWKWMVNELSESWETLPVSLSSVAQQVSEVLWRPVNLVSDQKYAKLLRDAKRLAASAEKEAGRAVKRAANKLARQASAPEGARPFKKHPVVVSLEKRLSRHAKSMDVYRYLDPTVSEDVPRPTSEDVADFLSAIEKTTYEVALWCGRGGLNLLVKLSELVDLVTKAFAHSDDDFRPNRAQSVKLPSKPLCEAENRA